jgi:type IV secretory pathway VirB10-like protein
MAISPSKLARLRALIALAGSPELEEARNAAYKACQIMREENIDPTEVVALLGPAPQHARAPAPPPPPPPERTPALLSSADVEREVERAVEQALRLRQAEITATQIRLWEAEQELLRRDREDAARRLQEQKQRELAALRQRAIGGTPRIWSNGAGNKSWW